MEQGQLGVRGTYLKYHDPKRPLQGGDPGVETINQSQPRGDVGKDIPGRGTNYCKGPRAGASLVGLKGRKKVQVTGAWEMTGSEMKCRSWLGDWTLF